MTSTRMVQNSNEEKCKTLLMDMKRTLNNKIIYKLDDAQLTEM